MPVCFVLEKCKCVGVEIESSGPWHCIPISNSMHTPTNHSISWEPTRTYFFSYTCLQWFMSSWMRVCGCVFERGRNYSWRMLLELIYSAESASICVERDGAVEDKESLDTEWSQRPHAYRVMNDVIFRGFINQFLWRALGKIGIWPRANFSSLLEVAGLQHHLPIESA